MPPFTNVVLAIVACGSPLCTLLKLWQLKEWRFDRLMEHLNRDGWVLQLIGKVRLALAAAVLIGVMAWPGNEVVVIGLAALALLSVVQIGLRRQPAPVWTQKAIAMFVVSVAIDIIWMSVLPAWTFLLLIYAQPLVVSVAWCALRPLDVFLKNRVLDAALRLRQEYSKMTVIGITGSAGKTTCKELLAHILKERRPLVTPEHVNTEMGVAQWLTKELRNLNNEGREHSKLCIVEMGAYRIGEIALLCEIARPSIGIITAIGDQHIALFGSREAIVQAKGELFASLPKEGQAFVNADSPLHAGLLKRCICPTTRVGTGGPADLLALDIEETSQGIRFRAYDTQFDVPLFGTHNVTNVLLAIAVARYLGESVSDIAKTLKTFTPLSRTFQVKTIGGLTMLDDTYNSSPLSFAAAISWSRAQPATRKILLVSGIIELGEAEERIHTELAGNAKDIFDQVYVTDPKFLPYFRRALGERAAPVPSVRSPLQSGDLLVCVGRMLQATIQRFYP